MGLAIPGQIIEMLPEQPHLALVDFSGVRRQEERITMAHGAGGKATLTLLIVARCRWVSP